MKQQDVQNGLIKALEKKIPKKMDLIERLMEILCMEKGAIYRRLRGEVPFSFFEVVKIAEELNIHHNDLFCADTVQIDRFDLNIIEYTDMSEADYKQWENYISMIHSAKNDIHSILAESSNVLPMSIYGKFDSLSKFYLFKYQYLFSETKSRMSFKELVVPERLQQIHRSYFNESKNFSKSIYIWDYLIFRYLVTDIKFFSGINLISRDEIQLIKEDLFALLDYIEKIALNGFFEETEKAVSFYISDVNLDADYSYLQLNDMSLGLLRSFILNAVVSVNQTSFRKIKFWIQSLEKSSTLITQSGAVYRADFFDKQRMIISEL